MPKPTKEQLNVINQGTHREFSEDEVYVIKNRLIDDGLTSYSSHIHPNLLNKFLKDLSNGVPLQTSHRTSRLPVGKSFSASMVYENEGNTAYQSLFGEFYIDRGRQLEEGIKTDDLISAVEAGILTDTSIGFCASSHKCDICGNDIRKWWLCEHIPGRKYMVEDNNGVFEEKLCTVTVGEDGNGELIENSLVYAGASPRAGVQFSRGESVTDDKNTSNLSVIGSIEEYKHVPIGADVYMQFSKGGFSMYTNTAERTYTNDNGEESIPQRSDDEVKFEEFTKVAESLGLDITSAEAFSKAIESLKVTDNSVAEELSTVKGELTKANEELATVKSELELSKEANAELTKANEELSAKAELGVTYKQELTNEAIELGVKVGGNAFNTELHKRMYENLSVDELKSVIAGHREVFDAKMGAYSLTGGNVTEEGSKKVADGAFATREEFNEFLAEEAIKYANENNINLRDAQIEVYKIHKDKEVM